MAVFQLLAIDSPTSTGQVTYSHSLGVTPKAALAFATLAVKVADVDTVQGFSGQVIGVTDGVGQFCASYGTNPGLSTSNTSRILSNSFIHSVWGGENTLIRADFVSWDAASLTLNWTVVDPNARRLYLLLFGGDTIQAKALRFSSPTATGSQSVTGVGFRPDVAFFLNAGDFASTLGTPASDASLGFGVAESSTPANWAVAVSSQDNVSPSVSKRTQRTDSAILGLTPSGQVCLRASVSGWNPDGVTLNWATVDTSARPVVVLFLKGPLVKAGNFTASTSSGTQSVTGIGFKPEALIVASFWNAASTSILNDAWVSVGYATSPTSEASSNAYDQHNVSPTVARRYQSTSKFLVKHQTSVNRTFDLTSFDSDGFTGSWSATGTADQVCYVALHTRILGDDVLSLSFTESSVPTLTGSDITTLSLLESSITTLPGSDDTTLSLTDISTVALSASDTTSLILTETSSLAELVAGSDSTTLALAETSSLADLVAGSDVATLSLADTTAVTLPESDATTISLTDSSTIALFESDTTTLSLSETETPVLPGDDTTTLALTEDSSLTADVPGSDTNTLSLTEAYTLSLLSDETADLQLTDTSILDTFWGELGGLRIDAGPPQGAPVVSVYPVLRAEVTWELNDIGQFSAQIGVTTPGADQLDAGMEVRIIREGEGEIFRGVISSKRIVLESDGPVVELEGYSTARELAWRTTQLNWRVSNQTVSTALSNLVSGTGWVSSVDSLVASQIVNAEFQGVTRFEAIKALAQQVYRHVLVKPTERHILVTKGEEPSPFRCVLLPEWPYEEDDETLLPITRIRISRRDEDIVTRVIPLGGGEGPNTLTLRWSTRTSPYAIQTMTGPDGQTIWYIEDASASATYGLRERVVAFKDVVPLANSAAELQRAANALYDLAAAWLQARSSPRTEWAVQVSGPFRQRALNGAWRLIPSQTVHLIARGIAEDWDGKQVYLDLDTTAFVRGIKRTFEGDRENVELTLTNSSRVVRDDDLLADVVERIWAVAVAQKTVPVREIHGPFRQTIDNGKPVRMVVDWDENVRWLHQAKLVLICRRIRSNASVAAAGGGQTSSAGSPHTHSISGQSAQAGGGQTSSSGSPHSHSVSGQTAQESGGHFHSIGHASSISTWTTPPYQRTERHWNTSGTQYIDMLVGDQYTWAGMNFETATTGKHSHPVSGTTSTSESSHTHSVSDHTHSVSGTTSSSESSHTHTISDHTHALVYGIFEGSFPNGKGINVLVNGTNVTAALGGPWDPAENTPLVLDITQWLQEPDGRPKQQRNTVEIQAAKLFDVEIAVKSLVAIATVVPV